MKKLLLIALFIVGAFAEEKNLSKIKFDPTTGEIINSDSTSIKFDPTTGEIINSDSTSIKFDPTTGEIFSLDTLNKTTIPNNIYRNKNNNQLDNQAYQFYKKYKYCFSGPIFSFTKLKYNNNNKITGASGISIMLGYYSKHYLDPVKFNKFNFFWHWGTAFIVAPYLGLGVDIVSDQGFYWGISTYYSQPMIAIGKYF